MTRPDIGQWRHDGQPGPDDDVDLAAPDAAPLVGTLAIAETGVDERDARIEIRPQPIDDRQGEGDLGHEHECRPTGRERRGDGLDVDRGLATTGHAVQEERARVPCRRSPGRRDPRPPPAAR